MEAQIAAKKGKGIGPHKPQRDKITILMGLSGTFAGGLFKCFGLSHPQKTVWTLTFSPFVQLQSCFAKHMLRLDEHRELGNSEASAERLATEHAEYSQAAMVKLILFRKIKEKLEKK